MGKIESIQISIKIHYAHYLCEALWINQTESQFNIIEDLILLVVISFECNNHSLSKLSLIYRMVAKAW